LAEGDVLRRRRLRPGGPGEVRQELRRPHHGGVMSPSRVSRFVLPLLGLGLVLMVWTALSQTVAADLPSPARTWTESRRYVLEPFFKDGEMNQGIGRSEERRVGKEWRGGCGGGRWRAR